MRDGRSSNEASGLVSVRKPACLIVVAIPEFARFESLTKLELPESQVTQAQIDTLKKALPHCSIIRSKPYP